jgi:outer membrane usher protein
MRRLISPRVFLLAITLSLVIAGPGWAYTQEELVGTLLEQNINPLPEGEAIVALKVNGKRHGDVEARIDLEDPFLPVALLREVLASELSAAQMERIFSGILSKLEWAGIADLAVAGITGVWQLETLTYNISTPGEYTELNELDFSPATRIEDKDWLTPPAVAGVINLSTSGSMYIKEAGTTLPLSITANALLNLWSVSIESYGSASYSGQSLSWYFGNTKAIYDIPKIEGRLFAGMVSGEGIGYQSRPELYGISIRSIDTFSRYDKRYSPSTAFTLQKPSTVRIKMNGSVIRTFKLDMGNYRIYDLPFAYGLNEFELEVEEGESPDGIMIYRPVTKYITTETGLLVGGQSEYGLSLGASRYELGEFFGSAFYRYGLRSNFTLATGMQVDLRSMLASLGFVFGTDIGGFILETGTLAAWDDRSYPFAFSVDLDYRFSLPAVPKFPSFGISAGYNTKGFTAPQPVSTVAIPNSAVHASANIGAALGKKASFGISGRWNRTLDGSKIDTGNVALNLGVALTKTSSLGISSSVAFETGKTPDFSLRFSLSASDPQKPGRYVNYSQPNDGTNSISYNDKLPILGGIGYNVRANNLLGGVSNPSSLSLSSGYSNQYFSLSGGTNLNFGNALSSPDGSIQLNVSTALAFAGGAFAISKPLYDSFIIFDPDSSTGDMPVAFGVNSGSRLISHGLPVAASLNSYNPVRISMDFPEADADVSATIPHISVSPGYRSGFIFRAGLEKRFYVTGYLVDASGAPISLVAADVIMPDGSYADMTFTDEAGMFQIFGLTPGVYKLIWPEDIGVSTLTLVDDVDGLVELGQITATRQEIP